MPLFFLHAGGNGSVNSWCSNYTVRMLGHRNTFSWPGGQPFEREAVGRNIVFRCVFTGVFKFKPLLNNPVCCVCEGRASELIVYYGLLFFPPVVKNVFFTSCSLTQFFDLEDGYYVSQFLVVYLKETFKSAVQFAC